MVKRAYRSKSVAVAITMGLIPGAALASPLTFSAGDLVISTVSCSVGVSICNSASGGLDTAAPIVLDQFSVGAGGKSVTAAGSLTLPQINSGANNPISGEYGSASEGILEQSANGAYLSIIGYGVNANTFNTASPSTYGTAALGQTTSLTAANQTGTPVTTVPRVVGLISNDGSVDTTTAVTGVFNTNNPRSAATVDGTSFYISGQGASKTDPTQGVFLVNKGATTATPIDNSTDTRVVQIVNTGSGNTLNVSRDYNPPGSGAQNNTNVDRLTGPGGGLPTTSAGLVDTHITPPASPLSSGGNNGSINLTATLANGVNNSRIGSFVYLSPEQYFYASPDVLYVADSGQPKNGNANKAALGEGGLQKWEFVNGVWTLEYDINAGLNLVNNANANSNTPTAPGVTGLFGLTGEDVDVNGVEQVELFATSYGLNELSPSYLYEVTDLLSATSQPSSPTPGGIDDFTTIYSAPADSLIRGVAFAPVPAPASLALLGLGLFGIGGLRRKAKSA